MATPTKRGGPVRVARHMHNAGKALGDIIVAGQMGQRTLPTKGGDGTHDQTGIERLERLVIQAAPFHYPRPVIFNDDIDIGDERPNQLDAFRSFEINTQAFLTAILLNEVDASVVFHKGQGARRVAARGLFDFDDVRSEFGHEPGCRRTGQILGEVEHGRTGQYGWFVCLP